MIPPIWERKSTLILYYESEVKQWGDDDMDLGYAGLLMQSKGSG